MSGYERGERLGGQGRLRQYEAVMVETVHTPGKRDTRIDEFRRVCCRLIPQEIERCLMAWVHDLKMDINREVIVVDGKTMRGNVDKQKGIKAAHRGE